jgi:hypothetical protein
LPVAGADWRSLVKSSVKAKAADTRKKSRGASDNFRISRVGFSTLAHPFLVEAARTRGISLSGYIRRAVLSWAAHDLGLDRIHLFSLDAGITPIGRVGSAPTKDLDETIYGRWEVQGDDSRSGLDERPAED